MIMTLVPAEASSGYVFTCRDAALLRAEVPACWKNVFDACLSVKVASASGTGVSTIEYLLAVLTVCGVHATRIVLDAPKVTIMDGSVARFDSLVKKVGLRRQI